MTDQPDIVSRLREYTRHNKPVLASDLKEAADYIDQLRRELIAAIGQRDNRARDLDDALGHKDEAIKERNQLHRLLVDIADATSFRGVPLAGPDLVEHVRKVVRDRDALLPQDLPIDEPAAPPVAAEGHRPGFVPPPARTWDEVDRRIAELESRVRLTERRLEVANMSLQSAGDPTPRSIIGRLVDVLSRTEQGLEGLARGITEARRRG